jgi:integrase
MTVERFLLERWLPAIAQTVRPSTRTSYEGHVKGHIIPSLGRVRLDRVTPRGLNRLYADRAAAGLSPATIRRIHATLHRALRDAVRWGDAIENPAARSDPPRTSSGDDLVTWAPEDVAAFLDSVVGDALEPLWVVLAMTGMRRGEALGLKWHDVDLDRAVASIRQTVVEIGGRIETSTPKTARGRRVVALDSFTVDALARLRHPSVTNEDAWVFAGPDGDVPRPSIVSRRFQAIVRRAGLPRIRLHDLRHTHATLALRAGVHPKIVSERLGHATVAFTLDVYSHAVPHMQAEAAAQVAALVMPTSADGRRRTRRDSAGAG